MTRPNSWLEPAAAAPSVHRRHGRRAALSCCVGAWQVLATAHFEFVGLRPSTTMKTLSILAVCAAFLVGCVSHRSCILVTRAGSTILEIEKDLYGLVPGVCGFKSHAVAMHYRFVLHGDKAIYHPADIEPIPCDRYAMLYATNYEGSISVFRDKRRVVVSLTESGYPFEFNGRFHY